MANRPLVITVDAQIDPLNRSLSAGSIALSQFGATAAQSVQQTTDALAQLASQPANAVRAMESSFNATVRNMQAQAQQAIKMGSDYNPLGGMNSDASTKAADKLAELAQAERNRAAAAAAAVPIDAQQEAILRVLATSSTAAAASFDEQALALRAQAAALALVEAEQVAQGTAANQAAQGNNAHAAATRQLNLGQMELAHVSRAVADSYAAGIPISRIAAMEIGRISEAMMFYAAQSNNATGFMAKFAGVMGGPWGIALTLGIPIITTIVGHIAEMGGELEKATQKLKDQAAANDIARVAQAAFDQTLAGSIEIERKMNDELSKQLKTRRELNMEKVGQAQSNINTAQAQLKDAQDRQSVAKKAMDAARMTPDPTGKVGYMPDSANAPYLAAKKSYDEATADLARATALVANTQRDLREAQAVYANDRNSVLATKNGAAQLQIEAQQGELNRHYKEGGMSYDDFNKASMALAQKLADLGSKNDKPMSASAENSLGSMVALLKEILPGVRITSTTGGTHVKGSDHYTGHAIDFVPQGGMGQYSSADMLKLLEDAGVKIRYNAGGTRQFFGPGMGPHGPDDHSHDNHFHVAWSGTPSPESADRVGEAKARRADESAKAFAQENDSLDQQILQFKAKHIESLDEQKKAIDDEIDAEQKKKDDAIDAEAKQRGWTQAQTDLLKIKEAQVTQEKKAANQRDFDQKQQEQDAAQAKFLSDVQSKILGIQLDLADTLDERRKIAKQILDNEQKEEIAKVNADDKLTGEQKSARVGAINSEYAARGQQLNRQYQDPMQSFAQKLKTNTDDMNNALKGVEADGLQSLEDGLLGIVNGTETVAGAFKKMASSILADLARIAVEKAILSVIGLKDGGSVGGDDDDFDYIGLADGGGVNGIVPGVGGSRQDNILTALSPGEFVINASSTARHRRLIEAINDNDPRIPHLAAGGIVDASRVAYPSIPSASSMSVHGGGGGGTVNFDLRGAVMTEDLLAQMNAISARYAAATMMAAPEMTRMNMQSAQRRVIPT